MLTIIIPEREIFDETANEFHQFDEVVFEIEHSLVSLSKWESKWEIPFLSKTEKTTEQVMSYIEMMCLTPNIAPEVFTRLRPENIKAINEYIDAKMTATYFNEAKKPPRNVQVITSELLYSWMIALQIPFECQHWHLNRLTTLIQVCDLSSAKPEKASRSNLAERRERNARRKAELGTTG